MLLSASASALIAPLARPSRSAVRMLINDDNNPQPDTPNFAFVRHSLERSLAITERSENIAAVETVGAVAKSWPERQRMRFSYMILPYEPLPQEILGLQALFGAVGAAIYGIVGLFLGAFQFGPMASMAPGPSGELLRRSGWSSFTALRAGAIKLHELWQQLQRWDEETGWSARVRAAVAALTQRGETMRRGAAMRLAGATA